MSNCIIYDILPGTNCIAILGLIKKQSILISHNSRWWILSLCQATEYIIELRPSRIYFGMTLFCFSQRDLIVIGMRYKQVVLHFNVKVVAVCLHCRLPWHSALRSELLCNSAYGGWFGSRPIFVIVWEWHIGLALLCGCSGALKYFTTNSCRPINKSLSLSNLW